MTTREHLEAARELIRDPNKWCQKRMHAPSGGRCALAAVIDVRGSDAQADPPAIDALYRALGRNDGLGKFNDTHTHAEVLELFNLAIADEIAKEEAHFKERLESTMERHAEALELLAA